MLIGGPAVTLSSRDETVVAQRSILSPPPQGKEERTAFAATTRSHLVNS
jgi:hypothetical protein